MTPAISEHLAPPYYPVELSNIDLAFPAHVKHLMPAPIPERELRGLDGYATWDRLQHDWFYQGIRGLNLSLRDPHNPRMDVEKCIRHLKAIQGSFEPKHQHKVAAFIFLCSKWFSGGTWEVIARAK